jgi:hypothetical protein
MPTCSPSCARLPPKYRAIAEDASQEYVLDLLARLGAGAAPHLPGGMLSKAELALALRLAGNIKNRSDRLTLADLGHVPWPAPSDTLSDPDDAESLVGVQGPTLHLRPEFSRTLA